MKKLRISLGLLVLVLILSGNLSTLQAVKIVPYGEITGRKTDSTTTDPSETVPDGEEDEVTNRVSDVKVIITPPLFSRGRVETLFPVSYKVPEQWLGEFNYDDYGDPSMFYYPGLDNFDLAVQVLSYEVDRGDMTDEEFLRYIMDKIKEDDDYNSLSYKLENGPDFPYARITLDKDSQDSVVYINRFYRILEDEVIMFQSLAFDAPDEGHVAFTEAMFLSQYVDDAKPQIPATWKSITQEKSVFRYPETWDFEPLEDTADHVQGIQYSGDDGSIFLSVNETYDASFFESDSDYFNRLESYAQWLIDIYHDVEIVGVDVYLDTDISMRLRFFGSIDDEAFEVQVYTELDTIDNRMYSITLETYADPEGPNWEMIELFGTIVETFEIVYDPSVGQA